MTEWKNPSRSQPKTKRATVGHCNCELTQGYDIVDLEITELGMLSFETDAGVEIVFKNWDWVTVEPEQR